MTTRFYIPKTAPDDKMTRIWIRLVDGRDLIMYAKTEEHILGKYWDNKTHWIASRAKFERERELTKALNDLKAEIEDKYLQDRKAGEIEKTWLKSTIDKIYHPEKYKKDQPRTLFEFIQHFIDRTDDRNPVCYKQKREYSRTFQYLKDFCEEKGREYDFQDIDLDFYEDWVAWLNKKNLARNTVGKKVQTLKIFLNYAAEKGMPVNRQYKSHRFKNLSEESEAIYLNEKELDQIHKLDLAEAPGQEKVRDIFLIGCWTGCRFSDLAQVTRRNIKDGMIFITQGKTGNKVWIPMHHVVKEILEKHDFEIPPMITNQKFNEALKKIAKKAKINEPVHKKITRGGVTRSTEYKKWQLVTSNTARRSFATNLYKSGFPSISIMQITGHKTEAAFLKYIKVTSEEHAKMLQAHWQKNAGHLKVV